MDVFYILNHHANSRRVDLKRKKEGREEGKEREKEREEEGKK